MEEQLLPLPAFPAAADSDYTARGSFAFGMEESNFNRDSVGVGRRITSVCF